MSGIGVRAGGGEELDTGDHFKGPVPCKAEDNNFKDLC